uniref:Glycosyltransferase family 48 protein n=1 Tax=Mycena chlorophos TaxID=658473 RepID=A0ABQ0KZI1_MYCCL|nr:predicted protein [Mycena chlorophos]
MSRASTIAPKYDDPPPAPARFIPRKYHESNLTTSATLIDDLSRYSDDDDDQSNAHKHPPQSSTAMSHSPVAATTVFARNAPPLSLPRLDDHLSRIHPPEFAESQPASPPMFPPMEQLAETGSTIEDLELNYTPPPAWRNRNTLLGSLVSLIIGATGSSAVATYYSLQGLTNTLQIFALLLSTIVDKNSNLSSDWQKLLLGTIPNILALNFVSNVTEALIFLVVFLFLAMILLYLFYKAATKYDRYKVVEGLQESNGSQSRGGLVAIAFLLTIIYLPLSTLAVHVLVWTSDLWVVPNPYTNATTFPPVVPPLGPPSEYRDPLEFCWTTTMKKNEVNFAPALVILSVIVIASLAIWFPIALRRIIQQSVPQVDQYSELGRIRNSQELDAEYARLVSRDRNPFAFLYSGYRRNWATYQPISLFARLGALLTVAVIDSNNCLFRNSSRTAVPIVREVFLVVFSLGFFVAQCILAPYVDPVNNASEWMSRLNYVLTAVLALLVVLNVPGEAILDTYVLYVVYVITYGFSFYFSIINTSLMQNAVKRWTGRVDFSIDIFSPRIDLSSNSIHTKRRIWQEAITTLFLTNHDCRIPANQPMTFAEARDAEYPPYLLQFRGYPAERHVENIKILRELGPTSYHRAIALTTGPDYEWFKYLEGEIQQHFIGPDSYWRGNTLPDGVTSPFGNAWWIPFPPTLVIHYDDGPLVALQDISDLEAYIKQNSSRRVCRKREVRMALRALHGQIVTWPYLHITPIGSYSMWSCCRRYTADDSVAYTSCVFRIEQRGHLEWEGMQLGSGFQVELNYARDVKVGRDVIGLNDAYDLTPELARFLSMNQSLIPRRLDYIQETLTSYRQHHRKECRWKSHVLSYRFLTHVYDRPRPASTLAESSVHSEQDLRVRELLSENEVVFDTAFKRWEAVSESTVRTWWYIFWDDLWRRNNSTISGISLHAPDFDPHYPTSIAYRPIPRPALEAFLQQRGLLTKKSAIHSGLLNKIYMRLDEIVFSGSGRAIMFHLGGHTSELDMNEVDLETMAPSSTLGTGVGTDYDASMIRPRPAYRWEGLLEDEYRASGSTHRRFLAKMGAWLGIDPFWRATLSTGLALDVRLQSGRYIPLES